MYELHLHLDAVLSFPAEAAPGSFTAWRNSDTRLGKQDLVKIANEPDTKPV